MTIVVVKIRRNPASSITTSGLIRAIHATASLGVAALAIPSTAGVSTNGPQAKLKTVEGHVGQIFGKLGLEPTAEDHRRVLAVLTFLRS